MLEIKRKLEKEFRVVNPEISIQKAFELLAEPSVSVLIFISAEKNVFYYLTELEINKSIQHQNETTNTSIKKIAIKSLIFDYDQYKKINFEYISQFKRGLAGLGSEKPDKILVFSSGKSIGLVSDLVLNGVPDSQADEYQSELDKFIDAEANPVAHINKFYDIVSSFGFSLNQELKSYILTLLENRIQEREQNKIEMDIEDLEVDIDSSSVEQDKPRQADLNFSETVPKKIPEAKQESKFEQKSKQKSEPVTNIEEGIVEVEERSTDHVVQPKINSGEPKGIAVIYNPSHIGHRSETSSPEMPERLTKIIDLLNRREKVFNKQCRLISDFPPATEEDLLRVHDLQYIDFIKRYASKGGGFLGDSTYVTKTTHELALVAVGGAIRAAEEVLNGKAEFALALIRPPGHHASREKYGGYCIYNNSAILARYLQQEKGLKKILILDWDAHAANGTMDIFNDDPSVMLISLHQDPHNYYPKTGFISQMGKAKGFGYTINMEMPRGSSDDEYFTVFKDLVLPLVEKFKPDFVIGCNGFDPHHSDQYTELQLTGRGYYKFCQFFREHMQNKMVILMEGGYNPYMGELTHTIINGLLGQPNQFDDNYKSLFQKVVSDEKIHVILNQKLKELKNNLRRYKML
jgi:acetoin utilization deacetylase AcuC-like enzyme